MMSKYAVLSTTTVLFRERLRYLTLECSAINFVNISARTYYLSIIYEEYTCRPGSSEVPRNPLTRWDVSSIPSNGIFLTKNLKK